MLGQECTIVLNKLLNQLTQLGMEYKQLYYAFKGSKDYGISAFLKAEKMERYSLSSEIANYLIQASSPVSISAYTAPVHKTASAESLKGLLSLEAKIFIGIDDAIKLAKTVGDEHVKLFLLMLHGKCLKEFNELTGVISNICKLSSDPAGMLAYQQYLSDEYMREDAHL